MHATNPFEDSSDEDRCNRVIHRRDPIVSSSYHSQSCRNQVAESGSTSANDNILGEIISLKSSRTTDLSSQLSLSPSFFPTKLSSWMVSQLQRAHDYRSELNFDDDDDDRDIFQDCISKSGEETTNYVDKINVADYVPHKIASMATMTVEALSIRSGDIGESTSLLSEKSSEEHSNHSNRDNYNATSTTPLFDNTSTHQRAGGPLSSASITSPLREALSTWLSPYANSAQRAGRRFLLFEDESAQEEKPQKTTHEMETGKTNEDKMKVMGGTEGRDDDAETVRFHLENTGENRKRNTTQLFHRVSSSPALMTGCCDDIMGDESFSRSTLSQAKGNYDTIVLKEIEHNTLIEDDGSVMHPWTKLIVLEELGTSSSWAVLLLPYLFIILALFLDGDSHFKNEEVGPRAGNRRCIDVVGKVAEPFGASVQGYFPVPFSYILSNNGEEDEVRRGTNSPNESGACSYPFELREGVGLLSNGVDDFISMSSHASSSSIGFDRSSIVDAKYRHLMSHGFAVTSGVIPNVPATSQSICGKFQFSNLTSRAVALVADGSILVSTIVFQRVSVGRTNMSVDEFSKLPNDQINNTIDNVWSPVLILTPKTLDLLCTLNVNQSSDIYSQDNVTIQHSEPTTWRCVSKMMEASFSLPNTALLIGGDLRVDTLLSHRKQHAYSSDDFQSSKQSNVMGFRDDYASSRSYADFYQSKVEELLANADLSNPKQMLAEISEKAVFTLSHQSELYNVVVEVTRIVAMLMTFSFLCYWSWSMGYNLEDSKTDARESNESLKKLKMFTNQILQSILWSWKQNSEDQSFFWWESPWITFPERRYLLLILCCLILLQNPLLVYAFFHPSLYSSAMFRAIADSLSGISVHGILFLWLCLVHGMRYHTADIFRRRFQQHRRVIELQEATKHIFSPPELEHSRWGRVNWYYKQYGDIDGGGAYFTSALRHKHDLNSDSFVEFMFPKILLLSVGVISTVTAATSRFPIYRGQTEKSLSFLDPNKFGGRVKIYVLSSIIQLLVVQIWGIMIVCTSFVTGERLKREPFLSTRPAQLAFRVLSSILLLGVGISITLSLLHTSNLLGKEDDDSYDFDTSVATGGEPWGSDIMFQIIRRFTDQVPYVDTSLNIGPGKLLYATVCSLVAAYIFLPSSHFRPSENKIQLDDDDTPGTLSYSKPDILWVKDKMMQGTDKRSVVTSARNTHTWRVFPLPIRSHGLMSQHTIKETLNLIGTFQLDGGFGSHKFKNGRGAIFKGRYIPVFCVEIACWLLEASWQSYYSPTEYSYNEWAPGKMRLISIGLKLEEAIVDEETDTHAYVATNISEQIEGEEDSIILVSFRGTASFSNMRTDLTFRQVPLPGKLSANTPSFKIRPGETIFVEENSWNIIKSPTSILRDIFHPSTNKYASWPTTKTEQPRSINTSNTEEKVRVDKSLLLPAVSDGAKELIRATPMARQALPCVHEGFLRNYLKVRKQIIERILSVLKRQVDNSVERCRFGESSCLFVDPEPITLPKIYITGHSLGGSLAQLLAIDLASNCEIVIEQPVTSTSIDNDLRERLPSADINQEEYWLGGSKVSHHKNAIHLRPPIAVYTFGQPRVGNLAFKNIYKQRVPHTFRVVTEGDAFTSMPTLGPCLGGIYRHAGLEVLLDEGCTGNILVGPTVVETLLRFTKVRTSVLNHSLMKYRDCLESALGKDGLKEYYKGHGGKVKHDGDEWHRSSNLESLPSWVTNITQIP